MNYEGTFSHSEEEYIKLHDEMFNKWKNEMLSLTKEQAQVMYQKGLIDAEFVKLRNFVKKNKDVIHEKEFLNLIYKEKDLEFVYDKYKWDSIDEMGFWTFFNNASLISGYKKSPMKVEHRLYVNPSGLDVYKFAKIFRDKCIDKNVPYDFKISDSPVRDDKVVIYTDTAHLEAFLRILNEIRKENPDIMSRMGNPPILTGKIGFIGYGSEPLKENGKHRSFNEVRSDVIERSIEEVILKWYTDNRNLKQGDCTLEEALVKETTRSILNDMTRKFNNTIEYKKANCARQGIKYSESMVEEQLGYGRRDLDSPKLYESIKNAIKTKGLNYLYDGTLFRPKDMAMMEIPLPSGKMYYASVSSIQNVIRTSVPGIMKFDQSFTFKVQQAILRRCPARGIDSDKFCFDLDKKAMFMGKTTEVDKQKEKLEFPEFKDLRELSLKYRVNYDTESKKIKVYDIKTGKEETNPKIAQDALFANIWLASAGLKFTPDEKRPGHIYAFNEGARKLYDYFIKACKYSIEKTGDLNSLFIFKNANKVSYKYAEDIIARLFRSDYQTIFLDNYIQNRTTSSLPRNRRAETLYDTETAYSKLSNSNQSDNGNKTKK